MTAPASKTDLTSLLHLWPYAKRYRTLVAGWLSFLLIASASALALPVMFRFVINAIGDGGGHSLNTPFAMLFLVSLVVALATAGRFSASRCWANAW